MLTVTPIHPLMVLAGEEMLDTVMGRMGTGSTAFIHQGSVMILRKKQWEDEGLPPPLECLYADSEFRGPEDRNSQSSDVPGRIIPAGTQVIRLRYNHHVTLSFPESDHLIPVVIDPNNGVVSLSLAPHTTWPQVFSCVTLLDLTPLEQLLRRILSIVKEESQSGREVNAQ